METLLAPSALEELRPLGAPCPTLADRLRAMHQIIRAKYPSIERISLLIHHEDTGCLRSFVSSSSHRHEELHQEFQLSEVPGLARLYRSRASRVIHQLQVAQAADPATPWLLANAFQSSYTVPLFSGDALVAFVFFDSTLESQFDTATTNYLNVFADFICQLYLARVSAVHTLQGAVAVARGLAKVRDAETGAHLERMARYSELIAKKLASRFRLSDECIEYVRLFSPLHDIGKVGIPDDILLKKGPLDPTEWRIMQGHVQIGEQLVDQLISDLDLQGELAASIMRNIVSCHHERGDGSGYPLGLRLHEIPAEAQIVAVADVYDALVTARPYKPAWPLDDAEAEMRRLSDLGQLNKLCVDALLGDREQRMRIARTFTDPIERAVHD